MCMDKISKKKPAPGGVGYKAFTLSGGMLFGEFVGRNKPRPVGVWLKSRDYTPSDAEKGYLGSIRGKYPTGWHIYKSQRGIRDWMEEWESDYVFRKVRYRKAHTEGTTEGYKVVVAKEIYIIP